jgi:VWFA-related protein
MRIPAAVVCVLLTFPLAAQPLTESVEVHVLEVEAVVLDRAGKTVDGLTRGDFEVSIDGKRAEITNFYRVRRGAIESGAALPSGEKILPAAKTESRLIVVLDDLHLRQAPRNRALAALRKYVETSLDDSTSVMILRWNGSLAVRMNASKERSKILGEIAQLEREPATMIRTDIERRRIMQTVHDALEAPKFPKDSTRVAAMAMHYAVMFATDEGRVVERTAAALGELVSMAAGLPGRKVVLYVSESLQVHPGAAMMAYVRESLRDRISGFDVEVHPGGNVLDDLRFDQTRAFQDLVQRAQSAGVIFSALDPGGLRAESTSFETSSLGFAPVGTTAARANETAGMRIVSAETGGRFIGNENAFTLHLPVPHLSLPGPSATRSGTTLPRQGTDTLTRSTAWSVISWASGVLSSV